jgi:hypothetical protein
MAEAGMDYHCTQYALYSPCTVLTIGMDRMGYHCTHYALYSL